LLYPLSIAAAVCAGLCGALLWLFAGRQPSVSRGASTGAVVALCSYFGVSVFGLVQAGTDGAQACFMGSVILTGWLVFPALILVGSLLGCLQRYLRKS
jgi:hypothetical protein